MTDVAGVANVISDERWIMAAITQHDGKFAGTIMLIRTDDDTSWGEVRQAWLWMVLNHEGKCLGRTKDMWHALKSGVNADPGPYKMLGSLLSFLLAYAEIYRSHMGATLETVEHGSGAWNLPVMEWAYQNDTELSLLKSEVDFYTGENTDS